MVPKGLDFTIHIQLAGSRWIRWVPTYFKSQMSYTNSMKIYYVMVEYSMCSQVNNSKFVWQGLIDLTINREI